MYARVSSPDLGASRIAATAPTAVPKQKYPIPSLVIILSPRFYWNDCPSRSCAANSPIASKRKSCMSRALQSRHGDLAWETERCCTSGKTCGLGPASHWEWRRELNEESNESSAVTQFGGPPSGGGGPDLA